MSDSKTDAGAVLRLLQASSCFREGVCDLLPCACAETLAALRAVPRCDAEIVEALEECLAVLQLVEHPRRVDPDYGAEIEALGDRIGYGALMSSASASWRNFLARKGMPPGGEFVAGPCQATVTLALKKVRAALAVSAAQGDAVSVVDHEEKYLLEHFDADCGIMPGDIQGSFHRIRAALSLPAADRGGAA